MHAGRSKSIVDLSNARSDVFDELPKRRSSSESEKCKGGVDGRFPIEIIRTDISPPTRQSPSYTVCARRGRWCRRRFFSEDRIDEFSIRSVIERCDNWV